MPGNRHFLTTHTPKLGGQRSKFPLISNIKDTRTPHSVTLVSWCTKCQSNIFYVERHVHLTFWPVVYHCCHSNAGCWYVHIINFAHKTSIPSFYSSSYLTIVVSKCVEKSWKHVPYNVIWINVSWVSSVWYSVHTIPWIEKSHWPRWLE